MLFVFFCSLATPSTYESFRFVDKTDDPFQTMKIEMRFVRDPNTVSRASAPVRVQLRS